MQDNGTELLKKCWWLRGNCKNCPVVVGTAYVWMVAMLAAMIGHIDERYGVVERIHGVIGDWSDCCCISHCWDG